MEDLIQKLPRYSCTWIVFECDAPTEPRQVHTVILRLFCTLQFSNKLLEFCTRLTVWDLKFPIKVDEEGMEAAAVSSSGVFATNAGQSSQVLFCTDHPFIYVISEAGSVAVLFAGWFGNEKAV